MTTDTVLPELDVFQLPVYEDADLLPMLADDEMADMVESIKTNGQREPITIAKVGEQWMLIDGRNRREACRQAGITPHYRIFEGDEYEIKAFILDSDNRRHNRRAQRSMRLAFMFPEETKRGGDRRSENFKGHTCPLKTERERKDLNIARFVRQHNEPLARLILKGHPNYTLTKAYEEVKAEVEERERKAEEERQKLERLTSLRSEFPDLASLVDEGRIYLDEAIQTAESRRRKAAEEAERIRREEEARLAEEERQRLNAKRAEREDYENRRAGFFERLNTFIQSTSIAVNESQVQQLDAYVAEKEWEAFSGQYRHQKKDVLRTLKSFAENLPILIAKLEQM